VIVVRRTRDDEPAYVERDTSARPLYFWPDFMKSGDPAEVGRKMIMTIVVWLVVLIVVAVLLAVVL
jgi:hypothetical protein